MKRSANYLNRLHAGVLCVVICLAFIPGPATWAQEVTAKTLVERVQIQDLITRYYYNFGKENAQSFSDFYADDAELILGDKHFKGKDGIAKAYSHSGGESPMSKAYAFNVTISNPLIVVHGDSATSRLIFTEYLIDKQGDVPHVRTQGREYSTFVKVLGKWRYRTRQIEGDSKAPDDWKE